MKRWLLYLFLSINVSMLSSQSPSRRRSPRDVVPEVVIQQVPESVLHAQAEAARRQRNDRCVIGMAVIGTACGIGALLFFLLKVIPSSPFYDSGS